MTTTTWAGFMAEVASAFQKLAQAIVDLGPAIRALYFRFPDTHLNASVFDEGRMVLGDEGIWP